MRKRKKLRMVVLWRRWLAAGLCLLAAGGIFLAVEAPAALKAAASARQLPIYSVERSQKVCAISFDAAWGDAKVRQFSC